MELIKFNPNELITDDYFDLILQKEEIKARIDVMDARMNESVMNYFKESGEKEFKFTKDGVTLKWVYVGPTKNRKVNYELMEKDGTYSRYVDDSKNKSDYVRMSVKYE